MAASSETGLGSYVPYYGNDQSSDEERLRRILSDISRVLKMDEFDGELQNSLQRDYPNYLNILKKRETDLLRKDCAIIFTGETSAGKSSMINLLLKTDILPEGMEATTKIVCKIMHSEQKVIKVFNRNGEQVDEIREEDITDTENDENSSDFMEDSNDDDDINPQHFLEERENAESTSMEEASTNVHEAEETDNDTYSILANIFHSASNTSPDIHFVEIHHPIRILKGNIMIVDTPGVGDCEKLNEILEEYLPYAVAFVFVVNPTSGGGMQEDRILRVMNSIKAKTDTMMCFEPADVIFVVNKWDAMFGKRRSSLEKQWNDVVEKIKNSWPKVNPDNIIKMSAKVVYEKGEDKTYSHNFSCFEKTLHSFVDKNINKRIESNYRFLADILSKVELFVKSRISAANKSLPRLIEDVEKCSRRLRELEEKSKTTSKTCTEVFADAIRRHESQLMSYIKSNDFKDHVLYQDSTLQGTSRLLIGNLISRRMQNSISRWIEMNDSNFTRELDDVIINKLQEIHEELEKILAMVDCASENIEWSGILEKLFSSALKCGFYGLTLGIFTFVILAPICSVEVCTAGAAVAMVLSYRYATDVVQMLKLTKNEAIEKSFLTRRDAISSETVRQILDKKYGVQYRVIFEQLFCQIIPEEINNRKKRVANLQNDREKFVLETADLDKLSSEFARIRYSLQSCHFLSSEV